VTAAYPPKGIDSEALRTYCLKTLGVRLAGGQGKLKGKIFRIGHMGYADRFDVLTAVNAVELGLKALGYSVALGTAGTAALQVFDAADRERR
jgi:aspartate aminotransferase-like enzyme